MKQSILNRAQCSRFFGFAGKGRRPRPGRFAIRAVFVFLIALVVVAKASAAPAYPLKASANGRYLVDSNGVPFLVIGDAPHSIIVNLNSADAATYLINRGTNGFNCLWIELMCNSYTGGYGGEGEDGEGKDLNGDQPFTNIISGSSGLADLTTPNPAYWSHVDYIVNTAATNGLQCFLTPLDQGGWTPTSLANGSNNCYAYGQFLGSRYASSPNIFWNMGNDFQNWATATNDSVILAIAKGILSKDTNHLMTIELNYQVSESLDDPNWWPLLTVNGVYTYFPTYAESYVAYNKTNFIPELFLEGNYEYENNTGQQPYEPLELRMQEYWSLLSGCLAGHMYGNHYTWTFTTGWQSYLNTTGAAQLAYFKNLFTSRPWFNLVPDQNHSVLTAGYGTSNSTSLNITANNYATAAETVNSNTVIAYIPTGNLQPVKLAMSKISGSTANAWWYNVTNGVATEIGSYSTTGSRTFTPPDTNDWVLVLDDASQDYPPPGTPAKVSLSLQALGGNVYDLTVTGIPGQAFALQYTTSLNALWQALGSGTIDSSGATSYYVIAMSSAIFFRGLNQ